MARILITSAIPYINGIKHLGNLVGSQLPADLYARYNRARGHEVLFLCATDEHGTPAELAAAKAGQPVADYCAEMHGVQKALSDGFRLVMTAKERLILVTANVVWSQSLNGNPWSHEMGIRFTTVCKDDLLFLQSVISTQL